MLQGNFFHQFYLMQRKLVILCLILKPLGLKKHLTILLLLLQFGTASATHIVGGAFSLKWISGNQYQLTLKVLRDCINGRAEFDDPASVAIFDKNTHQMKASYSMNFLSRQTLNFFGPNCSNLPTTCTEVGLYTQTIILNPATFNNSAGYYFAYERCCRNHIIQNILNPEAASISLYMEIPPPALIKNSTPYFTNNPNTFLCIDNLFTYNLNFKDDDGDSLYYSMVTPINGFASQAEPKPELPHEGPYPTINWSAGYGDNNSIQGAPPLSINPATGELTVNPKTPGVHVAAIRVEEFRFGKKLGEVRLELQFFVTTCTPNPVPEIRFVTETGAPSPPNIEVQIPDKICFDIVSNDPEDSLDMEITGPLLDSNLAYMPKVEQTRVKGSKEVRTRFCWQTDCRLTGIGPQTYTILVTDNGCPFPKSNKSSFTVTVKPMPLVYSTDLLCMYLRDNLTTRFYFGDTSSNNPYFSHFNIYRAVGETPYSRYDSMVKPFSDSYFDSLTPGYRTINYSYMMRAVNKCGFEGVPSDTLGTQDQLVAEPRQQKLITVTVEENKRLKIIWPQSPEKDFAQYYLYKTKSGDSSYQLIHSYFKIGDTTYTDKEVDVHQQSYCYHLMMRDTCDNISVAGKPACSILLKGISNPFEHRLSWSAYDFWDNGTKHYQIQRQDHENPFAILYTEKPQNLMKLDENLNRRSGIYQYIVQANEAYPESGTEYYGAQSVSNEITLIQSPLLHVPNAFTANNDGVNDEWGIRDVFVKDYYLRVYNRWGQLVFETRDKGTQWRGEDSSTNNKSDVYVYLVSYTGWDGTSVTKRGNVTLLR